MVVATALLMGWPLERAVYLAPVIVVGFAALAGLLILWGKVALQQLRESKRPRLVLTLWLRAGRPPLPPRHPGGRPPRGGKQPARPTPPVSPPPAKPAPEGVGK